MEATLMKIFEVESRYKTVGLMPGRYQPPHIGHVASWQWMKDNFGTAYIVTSDKVDPPRSPFNFQEKKSLFVHSGVPSNAIIQVRSPYVSAEVVETLDKDNTVVVFGVSQKDMGEDPRFSFIPKKDGSASFFQPYAENQDNLRPVTQHAYIAVVPTVKFDVLGEPMRSATEFRSQFAHADHSTQRQMIQDLYGSYSSQIHKLMTDRIQS